MMKTRMMTAAIPSVAKGKNFNGGVMASTGINIIPGIHFHHLSGGLFMANEELSRGLSLSIFINIVPIRSSMEGSFGESDPHVLAAPSPGSYSVIGSFARSDDIASASSCSSDSNQITSQMVQTSGLNVLLPSSVGISTIDLRQRGHFIRLFPRFQIGWFQRASANLCPPSSRSRPGS